MDGMDGMGHGPMRVGSAFWPFESSLGYFFFKLIFNHGIARHYSNKINGMFDREGLFFHSKVNT